MKTTFKYIIGAACLAVSLLSACSDKHISDLDLKGDCLVEAIALDGYEGTIDLTTKRIVVRLPEVYETSQMEVTSLSVSTGAQTNIHQGDILNMDEAKLLRVSNGDVRIDWALSCLHDEARISLFVINNLYTGSIDQDAKTITVYVPGTEDITALVPTITISENATVSPSSGVAQDFTNPVQYTVSNNSAQSVYTVTVIAIDRPAALFVGAPAIKDDLDPEARTACDWMIANIPGTLYASFSDIENNNIDMSECKLIWWHFHVDGGVDGHDAFVLRAPEALAAKNQLRAFYENGGSFLLTRYATNLPSFIGATGDDDWTTPNNCWGQDEAAAERCWGPWTFRIFDGQSGHNLYKGLIAGDNADEVYCTDNGYHITNSTAQYHIGPDWGDYPTYDSWVSRTGATILGVGGDGAIVAWEYPAHNGKGGIICIGSGCYDWYSYTYEDGYDEKYHRNIATITANAINHLTN